MAKFRLAAACSLLLSASAAARADGPVYPPPPSPAADCAGGTAVLGYPFPGAKLGAGGHCGTPSGGGAVTNGTVGQIGSYTGTSTIGGFTPSGDVTFASPSFTVTALQGRAVSATVPTTGQALEWNGSAWLPTTLPAGTLGNLQTNAGVGQFGALAIASTFTTAGSSLNIAAGGVTSAMLASGAAATNIGNFGGDVNGTAPTLNVFKIRGFAVSSATPVTNQVLAWDGSQWAPSAGGSGVGTPGGTNGTVQYNNNGVFGGYAIGSSFSTSGGTLNLATGAACFNLGPWTGDLSGAACAEPALAVGAASRNVGNLGGGLTGSLPNPDLNPTAVIAAIGSPGGDIGGPSLSNVKVTGIQGFSVSSTPPTSQSALVWNGSQYVPTILSPGVNQGAGDVTFGPGSGLQTTQISAGVVTNAKLSQQAALTVKANPTSSNATPTDVPLGSGIAFNAGALGLTPTGVTAQQLTVSLSPSGTACISVADTGQITGITSGSCSGGAELTADDGTTVLTADDAATHLTADGTSPVTPCVAPVADFSDSTGCNATLVPLLLRGGI